MKKIKKQSKDSTPIDYGVYFLNEQHRIEISKYIELHPKTEFEKISNHFSKKFGFKIATQAVKDISFCRVFHELFYR